MGIIYLSMYSGFSLSHLSVSNPLSNQIKACTYLCVIGDWGKVGSLRQEDRKLIFSFWSSCPQSLGLTWEWSYPSIYSFLQPINISWMPILFQIWFSVLEMHCEQVSFLHGAYYILVMFLEKQIGHIFSGDTFYGKQNRLRRIVSI